MILRNTVAALLLMWPAMAGAQPSFDCAKASNAVERAICADPKLARADRALATIYSALLARLTGGAKDHLVKDQLGWLANRAKACTGAAEDVARCVRLRGTARLAALEAAGQGPYPFVSERMQLRGGTVGRVRYEIDVSYPQFDGTTADFSSINKAFAEAAQQGAKAAVPDKDGGDRDQAWMYDQSFELYRPGPNSVSVATTSYIFTGGAHGSTNLTAALVDLRTGRAVPPADVFAAGSDWKRVISDIALADLRKQFVERPGFDDALQPAKFAELMDDPARYLFKADALEIVFNQYDVAAYVMGRYVVTIPDSRLRSLIRPDGPLGGR